MGLAGASGEGQAVSISTCQWAATYIQMSAIQGVFFRHQRESSVTGLVAEQKQPPAIKCFHEGHIMLRLNEVS
jgi:hypothetical protein